MKTDFKNDLVVDYKGMGRERARVYACYGRIQSRYKFHSSPKTTLGEYVKWKMKNILGFPLGFMVNKIKGKPGSLFRIFTKSLEIVCHALDISMI